jgi:hypothetical protein
MHPAKYDRREAPRPVSIGEVAALLPAGAERAGAGTLGEFDTVQVLLGAEGGGPAARRRAERAGAGWGGGRYELWRWGDEAALVAAWTWDTERDAAEFERAARAWLAGRPWATALSRSGARVAVVLTPAGVPAEPIAQSVLDRG